MTINIDVKSAIGSATAPIFRQPLGTGTTIDLARNACVDLDIVVEDQDTAQVKIEQEAPLIDGATLQAQDGQTAKWHWCPTKAQQTEDRYTLVLSADDSDNPKTIKQYLVVLRGNSGTNCPGTAPVISHTPSSQTTRLDLGAGGAGQRRQGPQGRAAVLLLADEPRCDTRPLADDADSRCSDLGRREERSVHRGRAKPGRLGSRGLDRDGVLRDSSPMTTTTRWAAAITARSRRSTRWS